jgi:hypothetical protein
MGAWPAVDDESWASGRGAFVLDWEDVRAAGDPRGAALAFARSLTRHGCAVGDWDPRLAASLEGAPPPVR